MMCRNFSSQRFLIFALKKRYQFFSKIDRFLHMRELRRSVENRKIWNFASLDTPGEKWLGDPILDAKRHLRRERLVVRWSYAPVKSKFELKLSRQPLILMLTEIALSYGENSQFWKKKMISFYLRQTSKIAQTKSFYTSKKIPKILKKNLEKSRKIATIGSSTHLDAKKNRKINF